MRAHTTLCDDSCDVLSVEVLPDFLVGIVQLPSCFQLVATPWSAARQASLSHTISWSLPKFMSIASVMPSSHLILWCPLLLASVFPSIRDFSSESAVCIRWPKSWSFIFSISASEYSGLISLKIDWFDLLAVQGTLRSLLQHRVSKGKASILWHSAFLMVQLSQPYVASGKPWLLDFRWQRCISASQHAISLSSLSCQEAIIFWFHGCCHQLHDFRTQEEEICHYSHLFPYYLPWSNGPDAMILGVFLIFSFNAALSFSFLALVPLHFLLSEWCHLHVEVIDISPTYLDSSL